jgi:hypothetical protein
VIKFLALAVFSENAYFCLAFSPNALILLRAFFEFSFGAFEDKVLVKEIT